MCIITIIFEFLGMQKQSWIQFGPEIQLTNYYLSNLFHHGGKLRTNQFEIDNIVGRPDLAEQTGSWTDVVMCKV